MDAATIETAPASAGDSNPATTRVGADIDLKFWAADNVTVAPFVFTNGAQIEVGNPARAGFVIGYLAHGAGPEASLDGIERFLRRCLTAVDDGRQLARIQAAKKLACGGVCVTDTWTATGSWYCGETDGDQRCCREEGHDGDHVACQVDPGSGPIVHAAHRWAKAA